MEMKKVLTAAVAALTIATAIAASTANVNAKPGGPGGFKAPGGGGGGGGGAWMPPHKGGGWKGKHLGYGFAAGIIGAAAYSAYDCDRVVPVFNRFGEFVGYRNTCDLY
jgi:hypothetical protein